MRPAVYFTVARNIAAEKRGAAKNSIIIQLLKELPGNPGRGFDVAAEPNGRPIVRDRPDIFISVSHSGSTLACAATVLGPLGIDLEIARPDRDFAAIAAFAFGPDERTRVTQEGLPGFYRIWTLREAIAKARGIGLAEVADRQDRVATGPSNGTWRWGHWHLKHRVLDDASHLALAVQTREVEPIEWIEMPG